MPPTPPYPILPILPSSHQQAFAQVCEATGLTWNRLADMFMEWRQNTKLCLIKDWTHLELFY